MTAPNDKRNLLYGGSFSILDLDVLNLIENVNYSKCLFDDTISKKFCIAYKKWIQSTKGNQIYGLENFPVFTFSNGTSETFNMFYENNKNRRFRCFKGEYIYHSLAWRNNWPDWKYIEDGRLHKNDAVVISLPFANTGNTHEEMNFILHNCSAMNIPVLIDCAYFGICKGINFNFNHDCITDVVFSLSKTFPVAHARIGIRFTKTDNDDSMLVYNKINYNNRLGAHLGLALIQNFSPDYIYKKYYTKQKLFCKLLNLESSKTITFGLDKNNIYPEYNRGSNVNRLSFYKHYTKTHNQIKELINGSTNT